MTSYSSPERNEASTRSYTIIITDEPDGSAFNVSVSAREGRFTFGATLVEAIEHAQDTTRVHLESLIESGEPVPDDVHSLLTTVQDDVPQAVAGV